jgi:hypothetical protein
MIAHTLPSSLRVAGPPTWTYYMVPLEGHGPRTTLRRDVADSKTAEMDSEILRAAVTPGYLIARSTGHPKKTVVLWPRAERRTGGGAPQPAPAPQPPHRELRTRGRFRLPEGRRGRLRVAGAPTDADPVLTPGRVLLAGLLGAVTAGFATSGTWAAVGAVAPIGMLLFADAAVKAGGSEGSS